MIKQILPLLFTFIFSINLFAQKHDIHKQIADIRLQIQEIKILDARDKREKIIEKLVEKINKLDSKFNQNNIDKKVIENSFNNYNNIIIRQDERIESIDLGISRFGSNITLFSVLITILLALASFVTYKISLNNAKEIAEKELEEWKKNADKSYSLLKQKTKNDFDEWFNNAEKILQKKVDESLVQINSEAGKLFDGIKKDGKTLHQEYREKMNSLEDKEYTQVEINELTKDAKNIKFNKDEKDYTFSDRYKLFESKFINQKFDESLIILEKALNFKINDDDLLKGLWAKAITLGQLGEKDNSINIYNQIIERFENSKLDSILEYVAMALYNKSWYLGQISENEESIKVCDKIINRFSNSKSESILLQVSIALSNKGWNFEQLKMNKEAIESYTELIEKFEKNKSEKILEQVSRALYSKGWNLGELGEYKKSTEVYNKLLIMFKNSNFESIIEQVSMGLYNKGCNYDQLGETSDAIKVYTYLFEKFKDSKSEKILLQVAKALYNKACGLKKLGEMKDGIEIYNEIIERFESYKSEKIQLQVSMALVNKGWYLSQLGENRKAIEVYTKVIKKFENTKSEHILLRVSRALLNKIELFLITGKKINNEDKKHFSQISNNKVNKKIFKMIEILENSISQNQDDAISQWQNDFRNVVLEEWSFNELKIWALTLEKEAKERILNYIKIFESN